MVEEMELYAENLGPVARADINFGKITVVAGHNSTGKSSLSKFLFSFLKANSFNRQEIALESFLKHSRKLSNIFSSHLRKNGVSDKEIISKFSSSRFNRRKFSCIFELIDTWSLMVEEFEEYNPCENPDITSYVENMAETANIIRDNSNALYSDLMNTLILSEFESGVECMAHVSNDLESVLEYLNDNDIDVFPNDRDGFKKDIFLSYNSCADGIYRNYGAMILDDVFYIDSVSLLDVFSSSRYFDDNSTNHLKFLKSSLTGGPKSTRDMFDDKFNGHVIELQDEINGIIQGQFVYEKGEFNFISSKNIKSGIHNTASGIKQIGIIQLLLENRELKDNCVLIIDEPEVNLHPEWQMKFAEILVLIACKLSISIYINTHSPLFVESVYTFSEYYGMSDETRYHLAEMSSDGSVNVAEVERQNLSEIYDNLGKPYLALDVLRAEKILRQG